MTVPYVALCRGAAHEAKDILIERQAKHVFLVSAKKSYETSGAAKIIEAATSGVEITHFFDFEENPNIQDVRRGIKAFNQSPVDIVVAIGGGSVLDMAKLINVLAVQDEPAVDVILGKSPIRNSVLPVIAIPTTAGTGSECTHFAVVYVEGAKYSLAHECLMPSYALIDPELTDNMPPRLTAVSGFDAIAQAIESYWSVGATKESKDFAKRALPLLLGSLERAVNNPDQTARLNMASGAYLAGKAINISKTTGPHALSYALTSNYGIPHGHAVALTLGRFMELNSSCLGSGKLNDTRGRDYVTKTHAELWHLLGCNSATQCKEKLHDLMNKVGLESSLSEMGFGNADEISNIVNSVNIERISNHPVQCSRENLRNLF